jgi:hypothetical protein
MIDGYFEPNPEDEIILIDSDDDDDDDDDKNGTESYGDNKLDNNVKLTYNNKTTEGKEKTTENQKNNENKNKNEKSNENKNKNTNTETNKNTTEGSTDNEDTDADTKSTSTNTNIIKKNKPKTLGILMSLFDFKQWSLENPPKLVCQFWMEHPKVVMAAMKHWIYSDMMVQIPYKWNPVDYACSNMYEARKPKKGENYTEITMIQVVELCEEFIRHPKPRYIDLKGDNKRVKYSPNIVKTRSDLISAELQVKKMTADVLAVDRAIKEAKEGDPKYLKKVRMLSCTGKRKLKKLKQIRDNCSRNVRFAIETIEMAVTLKKEAAANEKQSVNNAARLQRLFETWKDDEDEDDELMTAPDDQTNDTSTRLKTANSTDINNKNIINGSITIDNNESQISDITSKTNQVTPTIVEEPAFTVADVEFSPCNELKDKYINIMNSNIDIDHKHLDVTVLLHPETIYVLTHGTK